MSSLLSLLLVLSFLFSSTYCQFAFSDPVDGLPGYYGPSLEQYSGFVQVNQTYDSNLFFWLIKAYESPVQNPPTALWLNGGPGCSSLTGQFVELGPFRLQAGDESNSSFPYSVTYNEFAWTHAANMLFIDQPVGTGYSTLADPQGLATDEDQVAEHLYCALCEIFLLHPTLSRTLYLTGESYAGKYIPSLAVRVLQGGNYTAADGISRPCPHLSLEGVALGNALLDPIWQRTARPDQAHANAYIGAYQREQADFVANRCSSALLLGETDRDPSTKKHPCDLVMDFVKAAAGPFSSYDIRSWGDAYNRSVNSGYLNHPEVRAALHVDRLPLIQEYIPCNSSVDSAMANDVYLSTKSLIPQLLEANIRVLFYNGQFDLMDGPLGTERWLESMDWEGADAFHQAPRLQWKIDSKVAGYVRSSLGLTFLVVNGAGHMVPLYQPETSLDMFTRFVQRLEFARDTLNEFSESICAFLDHCGEEEERGVCLEGRCSCNPNFAGPACSFPITDVRLDDDNLPAVQVSGSLLPLEWQYYRVEFEELSVLDVSINTTYTSCTSCFTLYINQHDPPTLDDFIYGAKPSSQAVNSAGVALRGKMSSGEWVIGLLNSGTEQSNYQLQISFVESETSYYYYNQSSQTQVGMHKDVTILSSMVVAVSCLLLFSIIALVMTAYVLVKKILILRSSDASRMNTQNWQDTELL